MDLKEQIIDIINNNFNEFKGSNEPILHASEDIVELTKVEILKEKINIYKDLLNNSGDHFSPICMYVIKKRNEFELQLKELDK